MSKFIFHGTAETDNERRHDVKLTVTKGTFKLNGSNQISVSAPKVEDESDIFITLRTFDGTPGFAPVIVRKEPHSGFVVSGSHGDNSVYNFSIFTFKTVIEKE